jgi:uncharacterized protein YdhG (YjbR/CyaY superfamily)
MKNNKFETMDEYINTFPLETQKQLQQIQQLIIKLVPNVIEKISYNIPTFYLHKNLIHFAGYKNHIGLYPGAAAIAHFETILQKYTFAKGSIQFPISQKLPIALIAKMVKFNVEKNKLKL